MKGLDPYRRPTVWNRTESWWSVAAVTAITLAVGLAVKWSANSPDARPEFYEENSAVVGPAVGRLNWVNRGKGTADDILVLMAWWEDTPSRPEEQRGVSESATSVPEGQAFDFVFPITADKNSPQKFIFSRMRFRSQATHKYYDQDFWLKLPAGRSHENLQVNFQPVSTAERAAMLKHVERKGLLRDPRLLRHGSR